MNLKAMYVEEGENKPTTPIIKQEKVYGPGMYYVVRVETGTLVDMVNVNPLGGPWPYAIPHQEDEKVLTATQWLWHADMVDIKIPPTFHASDGITYDVMTGNAVGGPMEHPPGHSAGPSYADMVHKMAEHILDFNAPATCPRVGCGRFGGAFVRTPKPLYEVVIHLNDHHKWTRERIADWLDTLDLDLEVRADPIPKEERNRKWEQAGANALHKVAITTPGVYFDGDPIYDKALIEAMTPLTAWVDEAQGAFTAAMKKASEAGELAAKSITALSAEVKSLAEAGIISAPTASDLDATVHFHVKGIDPDYVKTLTGIESIDPEVINTIIGQPIIDPADYHHTLFAETKIADTIKEKEKES